MKGYIYMKLLLEALDNKHTKPFNQYCMKSNGRQMCKVYYTSPKGNSKYV